MGHQQIFDFKINHFNSHIKAENSIFENSKFGGKYFDVKISCRFWKLNCP